MKDTRFGENNNVERLQLLFSQLVTGMPDDQQTIERFGRFVEQKGETWARAQLSSMQDGYQDEEYSWSPEEDVSWEQIAAVVPDEVADFEAALKEEGMSIDEFCRDDGCDLPEWDSLSEEFESVTGLKLSPYCNYHDEWDEEPDTGFEVIGVWRRSPEGRRFFGTPDKENHHKEP